MDVTNDRVGIGTSSPAAFFSVGEGAGTVTGDAYFTGGLTIGDAAGINGIDGSILLAGKTSDPTGVTQGTFYYNSTNKVLKMYDGSSWFTMGTSTSGVTFNDPRLQLTDLNYYMTFGTTTQSGLSMMTLEATSTTAIPLTVRTFTSQTSDALRIHNVVGSELFAIDANGNASSTNVSMSGSLWVGGNATTTSSGTLTLSTSLGVASSSPYVALGVTGTTTSSAGMVIGNGSTPLNKILFGTTTIDPEDGSLDEATATTTTFTATGALSGDRVLITPANLPSGLYFLSASTTADNTVQVMIGATSSTSPAVTSYAGWTWMILR